MSAYVKDDGGREAAGFRGPARDCAARAYAIASGRPYAEVYDELNAIGQTERRAVKKSGARTGVHAATMRRFMEGKGWRWTPTMGIGTGCKVHIRASELPSGRLILSLSRHYAAFIDGTLRDTYDSSRGGMRCVYGYWSEAGTERTRGET